MVGSPGHEEQRACYVGQLVGFSRRRRDGSVDSGGSGHVCSFPQRVMFFFSSRRRHTRFDCDWSSDVCSSDLAPRPRKRARRRAAGARRLGGVGRAGRRGVPRRVRAGLSQAAREPADLASGARGPGAGRRVRQGDRASGARPEAARAVHRRRGRGAGDGAAAAALASAGRVEHGGERSGSGGGVGAGGVGFGSGALAARSRAMGGCEEAEAMNAEVGTRNAEQKGKSPPARDLKERTKAFALSIVRFVDALARSRAIDVIGRQLLRAGTSVAANYRSARRARSRKEFLAKMGIVEEEADESAFWLELLLEGGLVNSARVAELRDEARQLVAITIASIRTAREGGRPVPRSAFRVPR